MTYIMKEQLPRKHRKQATSWDRPNLLEKLWGFLNQRLEP